MSIIRVRTDCISVIAALPHSSLLLLSHLRDFSSLFFSAIRRPIFFFSVCAHPLRSTCVGAHSQKRAQREHRRPLVEGGERKPCVAPSSSSPRPERSLIHTPRKKGESESVRRRCVLCFSPFSSLNFDESFAGGQVTLCGGDSPPKKGVAHSSHK